MSRPRWTHSACAAPRLASHLRRGGAVDADELGHSREHCSAERAQHQRRVRVVRQCRPHKLRRSCSRLKSPAHCHEWATECYLLVLAPRRLPQRPRPRGRRRARSSPRPGPAGPCAGTGGGMPTHAARAATATRQVSSRARAASALVLLGAPGRSQRARRGPGAVAPRPAPAAACQSGRAARARARARAYARTRRSPRPYRAAPSAPSSW